jgi:hypothetical protein
MIHLLWVVSGLIVGLLISTVFIPPTRKEKVLPSPFDPNTYHTETGCVRFVSEEVPCTQEPDSLNLLASLRNT